MHKNKSTYRQQEGNDQSQTFIHLSIAFSLIIGINTTWVPRGSTADRRLCIVNELHVWWLQPSRWCTWLLWALESYALLLHVAQQVAAWADILEFSPACNGMHVKAVRVIIIIQTLHHLLIHVAFFTPQMSLHGCLIMSWDKWHRALVHTSYST